MDTSDATLTTLTGVGPALAEKLARLNLYRVEDLLFLLPLRYEDRTRLFRLGEVVPGQRCLIKGEVLLAEVAFRGRRNLLVRIADGSAQLTLRFFYFSNSQRQQFKTGAEVMCFGEVRKGHGGLEMIHPEYRIVRNDSDAAVADTLTPIYPLTEGVQQGRIRKLVGLALNHMDRNPPAELLTSGLRSELGMPELAEAIHYLHRPPADADTEALINGTHPAQQRLAFEELLAHFLSLRAARALADKNRSPVLSGGDELRHRFLSSLAFSLTGAQERVSKEIASDLNSPRPMMRLVQGDVGSGKTVVAALACLSAAGSGVQTAIMAPTELLAEQHFRAFSDWLRPLGIEPVWLSGSQKAADRRQSLAAIADGSAVVAIGTHALFQEGVSFERLGLVVIDEQHRFGVDQRLALRDKGSEELGMPHQLVMTATPIPRTLAMAAYADLDTSIIDELPPGRQAIGTIALPDSRRDEIIDRVRSACAKGQQAYWVCPLIEESEVLDFEAAEARYQMLTEQLPDIKVGLVHGRMKSAEKERGMRLFAEGTIQLLVATTVIEVGVDVPNASLIIIENAERMGLSQLHQLRGRVGRGDRQSHCVLMYRPPLGQMAKERLAILRDSNDGFLVAQRDLELRGPGELLGTRQTGLPDYRIANIGRDGHLMPKVQKAAGSIDGQTQSALIRRWLGKADRYAKV